MRVQYWCNIGLTRDLAENLHQAMHNKNILLYHVLYIFGINYIIHLMLAQCWSSVR